VSRSLPICTCYDQSIIIYIRGGGGPDRTFQSRDYGSLSRYAVFVRKLATGFVERFELWKSEF
jgi:hypothetical protein